MAQANKPSHLQQNSIPNPIRASQIGRLIRNQKGQKRVVRTVNQSDHPVEIGPDVIITGGIGDFLAIESFLSPHEKSVIKNVYLATRAGKAIKSLLDAGKIFPNLIEAKIIFDDWSKLFCFFSYDHLKQSNSSLNLNINLTTLPFKLVDYSILYVFEQIRRGERKFHKSGVLDHDFADISKFNLPESYFFIQPYSPNDRQSGNRDFTNSEWDSVIRRLTLNNQKGVVVVNSDDVVPDSDVLINLSNKTSFLEAVQIAKGCSGYIGVDSCFAALTTKFLPANRLFVKSVNQHYTNYRDIYASPHSSFQFIRSNLTNI